MRVQSIGAIAAALLTTSVGATPVALQKRFGNTNDVMRGVNLGGAFVLEPWITPSVFKEWKGTGRKVVDEWTYCEALGKSECQARLKKHWESWVTEKDIETLASLGLNHVRIPIGYWAFTVNDGEPYVQGQIPYVEKIIQWAGKHKLNVMLDLHGAPGSQNGFDNSGKYGKVQWQATSENIDRTVQAAEGLATLAAKYPDIVDSVELLNEPANWALDRNGIIDYYKRAYRAVRKIAPRATVVVHDMFISSNEWNSLNVRGWENVILDTHIYHVFVKDRLTLSPTGHLRMTCEDATNIRNHNPTMWTITGEWSLGATDCAPWLNGLDVGARWEGTMDWELDGPAFLTATCKDQSTLSSWTNDTRTFYRKFAEAQMDAYEAGSGWFFWNFKTETADDWNYMKLAKNGVVPVPPTNRIYSRYSLDNNHYNIKINSPWCHEG
ncbi:hypothetical protein GGF46_000640 [Coemansia sp. RSA 552]|nr:hypothetical protein GGF46_000640 [Coemansia sp. RSA 552]